MIKRITGKYILQFDGLYTIFPRIVYHCLSQEKLLQQLRARKVKLQQSKSDRLAQLVSEVQPAATGLPPQPLDVGHLESPLTEPSLDQLLARLESLEVRDCVTVWSTLIGRAPTSMRSHWSRASDACARSLMP